MTRSAVRSIRLLPAAAGLVFAALLSPALAQGTAEQREACTPDAIKLCSDTIPDVDRTTACMKAHRAELSPRCRAVFSAATDRPPEAGPPEATPRDDARPRDAEPKPRKRRVVRAPPPEYDDDPQFGRPRRYRIPPPDDPEPPGLTPRYRGPGPDEEVYDYDGDRARAVIGRLCDDGVIDPRTCAVTERALNAAH